LILGLDKKIDVLDKKGDVFSARTDERLKALETQVSDLKKGTDNQLGDIRVQLRSQDNRLWTFVAVTFLTILDFRAKFAFFSGGHA
jgi:hypothetical protein